MFLKPYIKCKTESIRNSERKNIIKLLSNSFSQLTEADLNKLIPSKASMKKSQFVTSSQENVSLYIVEKIPLFFILREVIYPTLYVLWNCPNLLPRYTVHDGVVTKLQGGAPLYLPGIVPESISSLLHPVAKGSMVAINTTSNSSAVAVGVSSMSSADMLFKLGSGCAVTMIHIVDDHICNTPNYPIPVKGELACPKSDVRESTNLQDESISKPVGDGTDITSAENGGNVLSVDKMEALSMENEIKTVDKVLKTCFLKTLVCRKKLITLPVLTNVFYSKFMLTMFPPDKQFDVKKTSYKKLSAFLAEQVKEGIIRTETVANVEKITSINYTHPEIINMRSFVDSNPEDDDKMREVQYSYFVTKAVAPLFKEATVGVGESVSEQFVRTIVTNYVTSNNLVAQGQSKYVLPDETLKTIVKSTEPILWKDLHAKVLECMRSHYKLVKGNVQLNTGKGKIPPIVMSIARRSGNKTVTLVDNISVYDINIEQFAKECQHGVQASTTIKSNPNVKNGKRLEIQGNQINFVYRHLMQDYHVPKTFIRGSELAPKK